MCFSIQISALRNILSKTFQLQTQAYKAGKKGGNKLITYCSRECFTDFYTLSCHREPRGPLPALHQPNAPTGEGEGGTEESPEGTERGGKEAEGSCGGGGGRSLEDPPADIIPQGPP